MSDLPEIPDLKFLPDWLKESEGAGNRYADYEGEPERSERPWGRDREERGPGALGGAGGPRRGKRGPRPEGGPPGKRGARPGGPRPDRGSRPSGDRGPRPGGDRGPRPGGRRDQRGERPGSRRGDVPPEYQQIAPAAVKVEFCRNQVRS